MLFSGRSLKLCKISPDGIVTFFIPLTISKGVFVIFIQTIRDSGVQILMTQDARKTNILSARNLKGLRA